MVYEYTAVAAFTDTVLIFLYSYMFKSACGLFMLMCLASAGDVIMSFYSDYHSAQTHHYRQKEVRSS